MAWIGTVTGVGSLDTLFFIFIFIFVYISEFR
jgi:hypothetical protein